MGPGQGASLSLGFTSIEALNLSSLKIIRNGDVFIAYNDNLCYADTIEFINLFRRKAQRFKIVESRLLVLLRQAIVMDFSNEISLV